MTPPGVIIEIAILSVLIDDASIFLILASRNLHIATVVFASCNFNLESAIILLIKEPAWRCGDADFKIKA